MIPKKGALNNGTETSGKNFPSLLRPRRPEIAVAKNCRNLAYPSIACSVQVDESPTRIFVMPSESYVTARAEFTGVYRKHLK